MIHRANVNPRAKLVYPETGMLFHVLDQNVSIVILSNTDAVSLDDFAAKIG